MTSVRSLVTGWIVTKVAADSPLVAQVSTNVYDTMAPQNVDPLKYLIFVPPQSLRNVMVMGARIIESASDFWIIKMVGKGKSFEELEVGYARIKAIFHRGGVADNVQAPFPITVTGGRIIECYERSQISYAEETPGGIINRHVGGLYFIAAQST